MNEVIEFLKKVHTYYIATIDGDKPRVRPFGVAEEYDGKLYIQTGKIKPVSKQIANNSNIEICAFDGQTWLRIEAKAIEDDSVEAKEYVLDHNPSLKKMYDAHDDNTEVLYLKDAVATFYSFVSEPRVVKF